MHQVIQQMVDRWRAYDYTDAECAQGLLEPRFRDQLAAEGVTADDINAAVTELRNP